jgi:hypothetical protein
MGMVYAQLPFSSKESLAKMKEDAEEAQIEGQPTNVPIARRGFVVKAAVGSLGLALIPLNRIRASAEQAPTELYYTKDHAWIKVTGKTAIIGVTDYIHDPRRKVFHVELPIVNCNWRRLSLGARASLPAVSA